MAKHVNRDEIEFMDRITHGEIPESRFPQEAKRFNPSAGHSIHLSDEYGTYNQNCLACNPDVLRAIKEAWMSPGPVPEYHEQIKEKLRKEWPVLANALEALEKLR